MILWDILYKNELLVANMDSHNNSSLYKNIEKYMIPLRTI